jgi:hypothetical protein
MLKDAAGDGPITSELLEAPLLGQGAPLHATPRHATPRHATPRHATPRHSTPRAVLAILHNFPTLRFLVALLSYLSLL